MGILEDKETCECASIEWHKLNGTLILENKSLINTYG